MYFDTSLSPIVTVLGGRWSHLGGPAWAARACWCAVTPPPRASPGAAALRQSLADCQLDSWSSASIGAPAAPLSRPGMRLGMSRKSAAASSPKIRIHSHGGGASSVQWESLDGVAADESGSEDGRGCAVRAIIPDSVAGRHLSCHWRRLLLPAACQKLHHPPSTCSACQPGV